MANVTYSDAIIKSLQDFPQGATSRQVYENIIKKGYFGPLPPDQLPFVKNIQTEMGELAEKTNSPVERRMVSRRKYVYFLDISKLSTGSEDPEQKEQKQEKGSYRERDLHPVLVAYLKQKGIYAKTIFQEKSKNTSGQQWIHPDIVGVNFTKFSKKECQKFFKATSSQNAADLYSYELKKHISSDTELKQYFFQAVSNSSWANYGYLVALDVADGLREELDRLCNSFGIGFILLGEETSILYQARKHELDFTTMNRLCSINPQFCEFLGKIEAYITADENQVSNSELGLKDICDSVLSQTELQTYCEKKGIELTKSNRSEV